MFNFIKKIFESAKIDAPNSTGESQAVQNSPSSNAIADLSAEEITMEMGKIMLNSAEQSALEELGDINNWDYAGAVFQEGGGPSFIYKDGVLYNYSFGDYRREMSNLWRQFRDVTQVEGDKPWIKCKAVMSQDGKFKMLFEFDDENKWQIGPSNIDDMYEIMLGDIFPEALNIER